LIRRRGREWGEGFGLRVNPSVLRRKATFGYGNWGGRLPRGKLRCGA
jgi:hypothetical protein